MGDEEWDRYFIDTMGLKQGIVAIVGQPGAGKTTWAVSMAHKLKKRYGIPVTSDFQFRKAFGAYEFFKHGDLLAEKERVNEIAEGSAEWSSDTDSMFYRHVVIIEEAYKGLDKRRPSDNFLMELTSILAQWRHFQSLFLLLTIELDWLDQKRVDPLVTHEVHCSFNLFRPDTSSYIVYNRNTHVEARMNVYGPNYWPLFNSFNPITTRHRITKKEYKVIQERKDLLQGEMS